MGRAVWGSADSLPATAQVTASPGSGGGGGGGGGGDGTPWGAGSAGRPAAAAAAAASAASPGASTPSTPPDLVLVARHDLAFKVHALKKRQLERRLAHAHANKILRPLRPGLFECPAHSPQMPLTACVCSCACVHVHVCMYVYVCSCEPVHSPQMPLTACVCSCVCVHVHVCMCVYVCSCEPVHSPQMPITAWPADFSKVRHRFKTTTKEEKRERGKKRKNTMRGKGN